MDIGSKGNYPANALSNFAAHPFVLDEVQIASMEGFLQAIKYKNFEMAKEVCKLVGYAAKKKGSKKNWKEEGLLYWCGQPIDRFSEEYQNLLTRAYDALFSCSDSFRRALKATGNSNLTHSVGKKKEKDTVLTEAEFCRQLRRLRDKLKE